MKKVKILMLFLPLAFLLACNEEENKAAATPASNDAKQIVSASTSNTADRQQEIEKSIEKSADNGCSMRIDTDYTYQQGNVIHGHSIPTENSNYNCKDEYGEILLDNDVGIKRMEVRNAGESSPKTVVGIDRERLILEENGSKYSQLFGGEWPDNEYAREFTRLLPKPNMELQSLIIDMKAKSSILFKDAKLDEIKSYAEQVKKRGFTINPQTKDKPEIKLFSYKARNSEGYALDIICAGKMCTLGLQAPGA
jgi:hypothetical protein